MKPADYKPIILKTVKDSTGRFPTVEAFVDHIVKNMETYEEMVNLAGTLGMLPPMPQAADPAPTPVKERSLIIDPASPEAKEAMQDVSERMGVGSVILRKEEIEGRIDKARKDGYEYFTKSLPPKITVTPNGFEKPLDLFLRVQLAPGNFTFIKIAYAPQGVSTDEESALVSENLVDPDYNQVRLDAKKVLKELTETAEKIYRPQPNRIPYPDVSMYADASLEQTIRGANSIETDAQASPQDLQDWGRSSVTPDVVARFTK